MTASTLSTNASSTVTRSLLARLFGYSHEGVRNLYQVFGYKRELRAEDYVGMYMRNDIANRIVCGYPKATWRDYPVCRDEAGDSAVKTTKSGTKNDHYSPFVEAVEDFFERTRALHYLERADRLSRQGQYAVLLLGFRDGDDFSQPLGAGRKELLYMTPYGEANAAVSKWDLNTQSPRYGMPELYTVKKSNPIGRTSSQSKSINVHWSRVLHVADQLDEDEVYGLPCLMPVFNRLMDLEKVVGGGSETYWLNARQGLGLFADKDAQITDAEITAMRAQVEEYEHQLRRTFTGQGITPTVLNAAVNDPTGQVNILLDLIAGTTGYPKRILIGSERGELASSQDENNWSARVEERRNNFAGPCVLKPFVDLMIATGNLPKPKGEWWIEWPDGATASPKERAEIAAAKANALRAYTAAPETVVPPQEFRVWLGEEPESEFEIPEYDVGDDTLDENDPEAQNQFNRLKAV